MTSLKNQLINTFPQLVILNIKECQFPENNNNINYYDLVSNTNEEYKYFTGTIDFTTFIIKLPLTGINDSNNCFHQQLFELNLFNILVLKEKNIITFDEFNKLPANLTDFDKTIHWIWFRENNFKLPNKIMYRIQSWIDMNPDFNFILWTNMENNDDVNDFISELDEKYRHLFLKHIKIKYISDVMNVINDYCKNNNTNIDTDILINLFSKFMAKEEKINNSSLFIDNKFIISKNHIIEYNINTLKICRLFKTDILRIIILKLYGGIYADFNDTICLYPMKYLLPLYKNTAFIGTDYSIEYPMYRNNYFMYSSYNNNFFSNQTDNCIKSAIAEFKKIMSNNFITTYKKLFIDFTTFYNKIISTCTCLLNFKENLLSLFEYMHNHEIMREILQMDDKKDFYKILALMCEIFKLYDNNVGNYINNCVELLDRSRLLKYKRSRNSHINDNIILKFINLSQNDLDSFNFLDIFLLKYAQIMLNGDLILKTNIAYSSDKFNLIPYCKSNRLSTISMILHMYDGTSYGNEKNYMLSEYNLLNLIV